MGIGIASLKELIERLQQNRRVEALIRYGGRAADDERPGGDLDLFVIVKERPAEIESLHFYVNDIPVDLNIRTVSDLKRAWPLTELDFALGSGELLFDRSGQIRKLLEELPRRWVQETEPLTEHEQAFERFSKQHVLDKVRHRLESEPVKCQYLLHAHVHWLLHSYYRVRGRFFPGDAPALQHWQQHEPDLYEALSKFYAARSLKRKVDYLQFLTDQVLEPIGGPWQRDEILAFGLHEAVEDLQEQGRKALQELLNL